MAIDREMLEAIRMIVAENNELLKADLRKEMAANSEQLRADLRKEMAANNESLRKEMAKKLEPINRQLSVMQADIAGLKEGQQAAVARLDRIEGEIGEIKENAEITREATNRLLEWAEAVGTEVQIPVFGNRN